LPFQGRKKASKDHAQKVYVTRKREHSVEKQLVATGAPKGTSKKARRGPDSTKLAQRIQCGGGKGKRDEKKKKELGMEGSNMIWGGRWDPD